ncbi:hypothetical protein FRB94_013629 [Tulasnella sp. JGI-2019a]|nr:hypothetical protein FRB94_013629 [Tulasnella sp. JGI-2019a]KAG9026877.1 hypothetical protein FRB95_008363 [Tulasnella sp. JGI-2019a]
MSYRHPIFDFPQTFAYDEPSDSGHSYGATRTVFFEDFMEQRVDQAVTEDDSRYTALRAQANAEGDAMARCFNDSQIAFTSGERARAKDLSNQGKMHKVQMERLHREASDLIFQINNEGRGRGPNEVDLHGLHVKEAVQKTEDAIISAQMRGDYQIRIIVGKGLHSQGEAKLRRAIEEVVVRYGLTAALDYQNPGVMVITLM